MSAASRLQLCRSASRTTRLLAVVVGTWFVVSGMLGMRHEAQVTHVIDARTGAVRHAQQLDGHHEVGTPSDIHGEADTDGDHDLCAVSAALHKVATPTTTQVVVGCAPRTRLASERLPSRIGITLDDVYVLAPKTSPPAA